MNATSLKDAHLAECKGLEAAERCGPACPLVMSGKCPDDTKHHAWWALIRAHEPTLTSADYLNELAELTALYAEIEAIKASIAAMVADNEARARLDQAQAWPGSCFREAEDELTAIAAKIREEIKE